MTVVSTPPAAQDAIAEAISLANGGDRVILGYEGKEFAAVISVEDLRWLEEMEDRMDLAEAEAAHAEMTASNERLIPLAEAEAFLDSLKAES